MSGNSEVQVKSSAVEDSKMQTAAVNAKKENTTLCVCFEGFDNQEKIRMSELLEQAFTTSVKMTAIPTKITGGKGPYIVVSKTGDARDNPLPAIKAVVTA